MVGRYGVRKRQIARIEDARLRTKSLENTRGLLHQQAAVRALAQRSIEQKDAWRVVETDLGSSLSIVGASTNSDDNAGNRSS